MNNNTELERLFDARAQIRTDLMKFQNEMNPATIGELQFRLEVLTELIEIERKG